MNPGYAGRTELPENLKALFRSCAMVVPDIVLICENMLMSEGFSTAKELSKKFMTLYNLSKSLLSSQIHYDWGLRAVKSVLRQAGGLKRAEPDVPEDYILRRGLKDFNWPKIIVDDRSIFAGLIGDLFPGIPDESKIDLDLQAKVRIATKEEGLQAEDGFVLKVVQTAEILVVRHCMFIIGNPGCAKSTIWKVLAKTLTNDGHSTVTDIVDPKAVTADELYGCMNPKTKEWKDGVLSVIMRDMNKNNPPYKPSHKYKWIILDGDVDPEWIESLNTVMDDNKVLTLVSQERIPMTPEMRLILEISNLRNATPATVSRGGVLFVNDSDIGCRPYFDSWLMKYKKIENGLPENVFTLAYTHYLADSFTDDLRHKSHITPICDMQCIQSLTCIVDQLDHQLHNNKQQYEHLKKLREENNEDAIKLIYEGFFVFAGMWAYGASLDEDKVQFSNAWKSLSGKSFKYEGDLQCFDYYFDPIAAQFVNWTQKV
jgi:dynein heavy chain